MLRFSLLALTAVLAFSSVSASTINPEGDLQQELDAATELANKMEGPHKHHSFLEGEAVTEAEQHLVDSMEKKLFGVERSAIDTRSETLAKDELENEILAAEENPILLETAVSRRHRHHRRAAPARRSAPARRPAPAGRRAPERKHQHKHHPKKHHHHPKRNEAKKHHPKKHHHHHKHHPKPQQQPKKHHHHKHHHHHKKPAAVVAPAAPKFNPNAKQEAEIKSRLAQKFLADRRARQAAIRAARAAKKQRELRNKAIREQQRKLRKALKDRARKVKAEIRAQKRANRKAANLMAKKNGAKAVRKLHRKRRAIARRKAALRRSLLKSASRDRALAKLRRQVSKLKRHSHKLERDLASVKSGVKPITTHNVLEDGTGNGPVEEGFARHVPVPDRQMKKYFKNLIDSVTPQLEQAVNIRQHILDRGHEMKAVVDDVRNRFADWREEMKEVKAVPDNWPAAIFEAEEVKA